GADQDPGAAPGVGAEDRAGRRLAGDLPAADGRADERLHAQHRRAHRRHVARARMEHYATAQQVFAGALIFARLGAVVMLIPGIGESFIPARIRLSMAFVMTLAFYPVLAQGV